MGGPDVPPAGADGSVTSFVTPAAPVRPAYPPPAEQPTQHGPKGIRFDFNLGCRVILPEGEWRICLRDLDTGNILFESQNTSALLPYRNVISSVFALKCGTTARASAPFAATRMRKPSSSRQAASVSRTRSS